MSHSAPHSVRVLLIEDDPVYGALATMLLENHGYAVSLARAATEGVRLAQQDPPHVIVTDMRLADMTGFEVIRLLKQDRRTQDIPTLGMTAARIYDDEERRRARAAGFDAYIEKPVSAEGFRLPIEQLLDGGQSEL